MTYEERLAAGAYEFREVDLTTMEGYAYSFEIMDAPPGTSVSTTPEQVRGMLRKGRDICELAYNQRYRSEVPGRAFATWLSGHRAESSGPSKGLLAILLLGLFG